MRKYLLFLPVCILLTLMACVRNEFTVTVDLPVSVNGTYRVIYYAHDKRGGLTQETALTVSKGHGVLKGVTRLPVCVMIYNGASFIPSATFYAERGDKIKITGDSENPYLWTISGNKLTGALSDWRLENKSRLALKNAEDTNQAVAEYVMAHPDDELSPLLIGLYYDRSVDDHSGGTLLTDTKSVKAGKKSKGEKRVTMNDLIAMLTGKAADEELVMLTARTDMVMPREARINGSLPKEFILQTYGNGADTIRLAKGKKSIMLFRRYNDQDESVALDTLRSILRQRKDSASRNIVELYLEADSMNWAGAVGRDTLRGAVRARLPREYADPLVLQGRIRRTPWWIVTGTGGEILYSGPRPSEAHKAFQSK